MRLFDRIPRLPDRFFISREYRCDRAGSTGTILLSGNGYGKYRYTNEDDYSPRSHFTGLMLLGVTKRTTVIARPTTGTRVQGKYQGVIPTRGGGRAQPFKAIRVEPPNRGRYQACGFYTWPTNNPVNLNRSSGEIRGGGGGGSTPPRLRGSLGSSKFVRATNGSEMGTSITAPLAYSSIWPSPIYGRPRTHPFLGLNPPTALALFQPPR